jgi:hypothetical protein
VTKPPPHACPGGCGAQVSSTWFACRPCWFRLPAYLRDPIKRHYRTNPTAHTEAMIEAVGWYQDNPAGDR